ncbi:hypothetical protein [Roseateles terrae]|uniref:Uncharacterized protein n=1 Tax=Roseateles terrae TaxID=431060 RepID=A0ABR6GQB2_9BURK|nr:hypothetical protein [Roseateles terrae]MBB3194297.1 hypothetical protein [Roseateles terrae]
MQVIQFGKITDFAIFALLLCLESASAAGTDAVPNGCSYNMSLAAGQAANGDHPGSTSWSPESTAPIGVSYYLFVNPLKKQNVCLPGVPTLTFPIKIQPGNILLGNMTIVVDKMVSVNQYSMSGSAVFQKPKLPLGSYTIEGYAVQGGGGVSFMAALYVTPQGVPFKDIKKLFATSVLPLLTSVED